MDAQVVVVGFGGAGACAALQAAELGARVTVIDRFTGGGATAISGGVVYAGGGTSVQREAGVDDSVEAMERYLRTEAGEAISPETLRRFCEGSATDLEWLIEHGVPFEASVCPYKTSYPNDDYYLYHSGSELAVDESAPPRGHRARAPGTSGKALYRPLAAAARRAGVRVVEQTKAVGLVVTDGKVCGVRCRTMRDAPAPVRRAHRVCAAVAAKPGIYTPPLRKRLARIIDALEARYGTELTETASEGVVLASGTFNANRELLAEHVSRYRGALALGTVADDGTAVRLGAEAGAATRAMDRVSAWRFITPPSALTEGTLLDSEGTPLCAANRYGAAIGAELLRRADARGWLIVDDELLDRARAQVREQAVWFQRMQFEFLVRRKRTSASDATTLGGRIGIPAERLPTGSGRLHAIDISLRPSLLYPWPLLPLGGLAVDETSGAVVDGEGAPIPGLFAAGRAAAGICAHSYVSGLSIADCVFSGRRAGASLARARSEGELAADLEE